VLSSRVLLMDVEFTCWEQNVATRWEDRSNPREILAVGLVALDADSGEVRDQFHAWVKPRIHPQLSVYCLNLLRVTQAEIDRAQPLTAILAAIARWTTACTWVGAPTCSWGRDRRFLNADVRRHGCADPFQGRAHIDVMTQVRQMLGLPSDTFFDRDHARAILQLPACTSRHDALADALDLAGFYGWLRAASPQSMRHDVTARRSGHVED